MTLEEARKFIDYRTNPIKFISECIKILHPSRGKIPFNTYPFQNQLIKNYINNHDVIVLKSRQTGLSTISQSIGLWSTIFYNDYSILILSTGASAAGKFLESVKQMYYALPDFIKNEVRTIDFSNTNKKKKDDDNTATLKNNVSEMWFSNGSKIKAMPSTDRVRGESFNTLIIDEAAFIENIENVYMAVSPTLSRAMIDNEGYNKPYGTIICSCVVKDTFVYTDKGIKQIENFIDYDKKDGYYIKPYSVLGKDTLREGNIFFNNGYQPTKIIKSRHSYLEGTYTHKVWACKNGIYDWFKLEDLNIGDYISIQYGKEIWGNNDDISSFNPIRSKKLRKKLSLEKNITPDLAYFFGLYISEGSSYRKYNKNGNLVGGSISLTCGDDISKAINCLGISYYKSKDNIHYTINSKELIEFMEYIGFDLSRHAKEKIIPKKLLEMSRKNIIALIQGIMDGDGFSRKDRGTIGIALTSKKLIQQIKIILLNFGILTDYSEYDCRPTKKVNVWSKNYRINANGYNSIIYYDKIGFRFNRKQKNKEILSNIKIDFSTRDIIPFKNQYFRNLCKKNNISRIKYSLNDKIDGNRYNISKSKVFKLFKENEFKDLNKEDINFIEQNINENLYWDEILNIEDSSNETFDFSLPNTSDNWCHSVIYNGILGHQTPNGIGGWYYNMWTDAVAGKNSFKPFKVHWKEVPEFDSNWYKKQCQLLNYDSRSIAQELELSFESSGLTYIEGHILKKIEIMVPRAYNVDKCLWMWGNHPNELSTYIMGVDSSFGTQNDDSSFVIIDSKTLVQVAEYANNKIIVDDFAPFIMEIAKLYNNAYINIERNTVGKIVIEKILRSEEFFGMRLYKDDSEGDLINYKDKSKSKEQMKKKVVQTGYGTLLTGNMRDTILGNMKNIIIENYFTEKEKEQLENVNDYQNFQEVINNNNFSRIQGIIRSERLLNQLQTFIVTKNGRAESLQSKHDDIVLAYAHTLWCHSKMKLKLLSIENGNIMYNISTYKKPTNNVEHIQEKMPERFNLSQDEISEILGMDDIGMIKDTNNTKRLLWNSLYQNKKIKG